jgi:hypothetical protein
VAVSDQQKQRWAAMFATAEVKSKKTTITLPEAAVAWVNWVLDRIQPGGIAQPSVLSKEMSQPPWSKELGVETVYKNDAIPKESFLDKDGNVTNEKLWKQARGQGSYAYIQQCRALIEARTDFVRTGNLESSVGYEYTKKAPEKK